jgi:hypothetical protein
MKGKYHLEAIGREGTIKVDLKGGLRVWAGFNISGYGPVRTPYENGNGPSGSIKEFLYYLSNDQILEMDCSIELLGRNGQSSSHTIRNFAVLPSFVHTFHALVLLTQMIL